MKNTLHAERIDQWCLQEHHCFAGQGFVYVSVNDVVYSKHHPLSIAKHLSAPGKDFIAFFELFVMKVYCVILYIYRPKIGFQD